MRTPRSVLAAVLLLGALGAAVASRAGQPADAEPVLGEMVYHDISAPLTELEPDPATSPRVDESQLEQDEEVVGDSPERQDGRDFGEAQRRANMPKIRGTAPSRDAVAQTSFGAVTSAPTLGTGFNGLNSSGGSWGGYLYAPPDTSMDVSPTQIVQTVNVGLAVYSKSGSLLVRKATNALWANFDGGLCQTTNNGDAVVLYDRLSQHWVVSQFATKGANGTTVKYLQCVAISVTSDATGSWSRYSFAYSFFPDYPKMSVWPNAYYTSFNGFTSSFGWYGSVVCAYDRTTMLAQLANTNPAPVKQQCYTNSSYSSLLVATPDGARAPTDNQAYALALRSTGSTGTLASWRFQPDWTQASGTALGVSGPSVITVAGYDLSCGGGSCIPQAGTTNLLDSLGDRLMYRYVYRQLTDTTATMAVAHSVTSGGVAGVRWYQFTPTSGANTVPTLSQQGTYQPDSSYRWMPSIAIDNAANLGLVYSISSGASVPSIAFTGRAPTDAAGIMGAGETILRTGGGSQTGTLDRWGDYAAAVVDPADDCTIWTSTEYQPADGSFNWATWIAPVTLPGCTSSGGGAQTPVATTVTVTPSPTSVPASTTKQFTAVVKDQFGATMSVPVTWSATVGTMSSGGLLTAQSTGTSTPGTVTATTATGPMGTATVTVTALSWATGGAPGNFTAPRGSSGSTSFTVDRTYDTNPLTLAVSGVPGGVTCGFSSTINNTGSATLTCSAKSSAKVKTSTLTITVRDSLGTTLSKAVSLTVT